MKSSQEPVQIRGLVKRFRAGWRGSKEVLGGLDLDVPRGTIVGLLGVNGSGKTTLLKTLVGLLRADAGEVRVLGDDPWQMQMATKRRVGYVPQESVLFSKSIQENVLFGRPVPEGWDGDAAWARRCLSVAQMDGDLEELPKEMKTIVGQKGSLVSGGQKQRIAIARALAGRPRLLLLDDCTAALDARNEDRFWSELDEELTGCTCFIVSHRLATIRQADQILVLEDGCLVDQGAHEELALRCETYREFLRTERKKAHLELEGAGEPVPVGGG